MMQMKHLSLSLDSSTVKENQALSYMHSCLSNKFLLLHLDNYFSIEILRNMETPEEVSLGPDTSSTRTFQGTFSAQEEAPPTTFTLMLPGQEPTSLFPQMASSPISTPATDPSTITSSTTNIVCQVYTASLLAAYINNILSQILARVQKM